METTTTEIPHKLVTIVKGNTANLEFCRGGKLFYSVIVEDTKYTFPIDVTDINEVGTAKFELTDKASIFMRYINKAIKAYEKGIETGDFVGSDRMIRWEAVITDSTIGISGEKL